MQLTALAKPLMLMLILAKPLMLKLMLMLMPLDLAVYNQLQPEHPSLKRAHGWTITRGSPSIRRA